jgi:hypothetical protein
MSSLAWREWLTAIHAEIKGQIAAGCWHCGKCLLPALVCSAAPWCSLKSCTPTLLSSASELASVSMAHPRNLANTQMSPLMLPSLALSKRRWDLRLNSGAPFIYSGDWTQAYLFALNTAPQYMAAPRAMLSKHTPNGERMCLRLHKALYGGKASAGLWGACCDTWYTNYGFRRYLGDPRLYVLTRGTARITMVLATGDTSTSAPHEKYFPVARKCCTTSTSRRSSPSLSVLMDPWASRLKAKPKRWHGSIHTWSHRSRHACYCQQHRQETRRRGCSPRSCSRHLWHRPVQNRLRQRRWPHCSLLTAQPAVLASAACSGCVVVPCPSLVTMSLHCLV